MFENVPLVVFTLFFAVSCCCCFLRRLLDALKTASVCLGVINDGDVSSVHISSNAKNVAILSDTE